MLPFDLTETPGRIFISAYVYILRNVWKSRFGRRYIRIERGAFGYVWSRFSFVSSLLIVRWLATLIHSPSSVSGVWTRALYAVCIGRCGCVCMRVLMTFNAKSIVKSGMVFVSRIVFLIFCCCWHFDSFLRELRTHYPSDFKYIHSLTHGGGELEPLIPISRFPLILSRFLFHSPTIVVVVVVIIRVVVVVEIVKTTSRHTATSHALTIDDVCCMYIVVFLLFLFSSFILIFIGLLFVCARKESVWVLSCFLWIGYFTSSQLAYCNWFCLLLLFLRESTKFNMCNQQAPLYRPQIQTYG